MYDLCSSLTISSEYLLKLRIFMEDCALSQQQIILSLVPFSFLFTMCPLEKIKLEYNFWVNFPYSIFKFQTSKSFFFLSVWLSRFMATASISLPVLILFSVHCCFLDHFSSFLVPSFWWTFYYIFVMFWRFISCQSIFMRVSFFWNVSSTGRPSRQL